MLMGVGGVCLVPSTRDGCWPVRVRGATRAPPNSSVARPNPWRAHLTLVVRPRAVRFQAAPRRPPREFAGVWRGSAGFGAPSSKIVACMGHCVVSSAARGGERRRVGE